MMNPFKFGVLVDDDFFTDRIGELKEIQQSLNSANHLILISPRRFGKSSLVAKAVKASGRPSISLNMQNMLSVEDFSSKLLRELFRLYPMERIKHLMTHFRIIPTVSTNPVTNGIDVSFQPVVNSMVLLEDAMELADKVSTEDKKLIVVFDEFQDILNIRKDLDKQLRSIMQQQQHLNYILLGSQESMMTEIFERKRSPFYHFGKLMHLDRIPYKDFRDYIFARLPLEDQDKKASIVEEILSFTRLHPYYTQQLSAQVWEMMTYDQIVDGVVAVPFVDEGLVTCSVVVPEGD
jgi:AAA+ ATPase superfamily predicted ATPase